MQQGMLFHSLSAREPGVDIEQILGTLHEELDVPAFERAWERVVERHAILRTRFRWEGLEEPRQEVSPQAEIRLAREDWRNLAAAEQASGFESFLEADRRQGFDLTRAPALRLGLFRTGEAEYQFVFSFHHLLLDGRALTVVLKEAFAYYEAFRLGEDLELPPPRPYRDYIIEWLKQTDLTLAEAFWRRALKGFAAPTPLAVAHAASGETKAEGIRGEQQIGLSETATTWLKAAAKKHDLTLNTLVQGAWALLLSRYSGETDVVFGAIRACRHATVAGAESMVGLFINTVPIRVRVTPKCRLLPWLAGLRQDWIALRPFEHTPLVNIQGWSDVPRGQPLFESIFNFQDPSWNAALRAQGGSWANREFDLHSQSNYPLAVDAYGGDALLIKILYHRTRFDDAAIRRMLGHFATLLEGMAANPEVELAQLPMLTEAERHQLLAGWNDTAADFPSDKCAHELFEAQAGRTPDALAVVDSRQQLSYGELNCRADNLAHHLRVLGVGPEVLVGVCLERSVEMVVAKLAVWKAGGAYLPLDPSYPKERLRFMLEDAKVPVLLTQNSLRANLQFQIPNLNLLCVDMLLDATRNPQHESRMTSHSALRTPHSHNLAYVIYTSGSTGTPKGVEIEHAGLVNLIAWHQRTYQVAPSDRATQLATPAFDASVWELWPYLTAGASIHIPDEETRLSPLKLSQWLAANRITLTFIPTPMAEAMLDVPWPEQCVLRAVLTGGDKLHRTPPESFPCPLLNHYGPTENTVVSTWTTIPLRLNTAAPPIGRPVSNTQVYVLDGQLQPVPIGVTGELHVSGVGLARGYLRRPGLTAEKFIPNPFSRDPRARLYRTGDLVRWLPDGNLEFLGRGDQQVKVRGNRIELGEIETLLGRHPSVREAAVVVREDVTGQSRIVAYIVPQRGGQSKQPLTLALSPSEGDREKLSSSTRETETEVEGVTVETTRGGQRLFPLTRRGGEGQGEGEQAEKTAHPLMDDRPDPRLSPQSTPSRGPRKSATPADELRRFLQTQMPDYMLPAAFVWLDTLPLTPNGKVDRQGLPAPKLESEKPFVAPRTPTESSLAVIWREVLRLERVGVHDNFFELGGHSLLATQVISRVRSVCQVNLPLYDFFESPTLAGLAERIEAAGRAASTIERDALSPGKPDVMTAAPVAGEAPDAGIPHTERNGDLPLSFAQERLWFLEQLEPGLAFNNIPIALRLEGSLNVPAFEAALNEIVRRHATFRTTFEGHQGQPRAFVAPAAPLAIRYVDLAMLSPAERQTWARKLIVTEARHPLDLTQSPLLRAKLLRLAADEHWFLLVTHHIACDGWSLGVLYRELATLYEAFAHERPAPLAELPIDYADFAEWQRQCLRGDVLDRQLAYWKQRLAGKLPTLDLPTDRPRPPVQTYRGATKDFELPAPLSAQLAQLSRDEGVTLFMLLLAAFQTLLHRYSGQDDVLVGSPIAGRTRVETENLIGFFLNTLVLRGDLSGDPTFRVLLQRLRQTALDAYAHQDLPFEKLVDALQLERDLSRSPLFQVMFVLQNEPLRPLELAGLKLKPLHVHSGTAKFDLMLSIEEGADGLAGFIEYNTDLFDESTVSRMLGHFQTLLEGIIANPAQRLSQLPLLPAAERRQMLVEWNDTRAIYPEDLCIHELIAGQVERTPDAVALVFDTDQLTYRELDERAERLAAELRALGVGPDVPVGLCVGRSLEMMVSLLGILKAGGCYVPLDPTYPKERLTFMLQDSQAPVLLTQRALRADCKFEIANLKLFCVDELLDLRRFAPPEPRGAGSQVLGAPRATHHSEPLLNATRNTQHEFRPHQPSAISHQPSTSLAYVLYTSGSTGKPKGVMVTHRNVVNFFAGMDRLLGAEPGVWLAVTSISFDISVLELFWTLARGFKVIIQPDEDWLRTPGPRATGETQNGQWRSVPEQIFRHGVTHMQCTPSLAGTLVLAPESLEALRRLSKLLLGGEALPVTLATRLREILRGDLINMYGPTETTVWSATHHVAEVGHTVPIGRPIANTEIFILDRNLEPVPAGVPGELFIGGDGVARGYWNRPELTAEKFIRHPFNSGPNARLYRTGDLARYRSDGVIEFLGRLDHQVKLRGHRIELGEIESALRELPDVRECVVHVWEDSPGNKRLVAYIVPARATAALAGELRRFLEPRLPGYMIPAAFVSLDRLPLTPNRKVDRKALPKPETLRPERSVGYVAPRTDTEKAIAQIWQELLHVEKVGLRDNFFDLGGHSLLVVQAQARLREVLRKDLPVVRLFQYPTISALAKFLDQPPEQTRFRQVQERGRRQRAVFAHRDEQEVAA